MPTHIRADPRAIAPFVLLPGDPGRARYLADRFLNQVTIYNDYRQLIGLTGTYKGVRVSIQTTGMGAPSAAIISEELAMLGAKTFVRLGTCGTIQPNLALGDLIVIAGARGENGATRELTGQADPRLATDSELRAQALRAAGQLGLIAHQGEVATLDLFYDPDRARIARLQAEGVLALEMEASVILAVAQGHGIRAAGLLTVSDRVQEEIRADDEIIRLGVDNMARLALESLAHH